MKLVLGIVGMGDWLRRDREVLRRRLVKLPCRNWWVENNYDFLVNTLLNKINLIHLEPHRFSWFRKSHFRLGTS